MYTTKKLICLTLILITCYSCGKEKYKTVQIGSQVWMAENLNVEHFRNGDEIPQMQNENEFHNLKRPAWRYYEKREKNGVENGKLYNGYVVLDSRNIAPKGWHVANQEDWKTLTTYLGGADVAGKKMKSIYGWNNDGNGTNESRFNGLASGKFGDTYREGFRDCDKGLVGTWWIVDPPYHHFFGLIFERDDSWLSESFKEDGMSVRCVKD